MVMDALQNYSRKTKIDDAVHTLYVLENGFDPYFFTSVNVVHTVDNYIDDMMKKYFTQKFMEGEAPGL